MKRPRIGIVGTFDIENFGDLLFPLVARRELEERLRSAGGRRLLVSRRRTW